MKRTPVCGGSGHGGPPSNGDRGAGAYDSELSARALNRGGKRRILCFVPASPTAAARDGSESPLFPNEAAFGG